MIPQLIVVHDIRDAVGVPGLMNILLQEMGGQYFFIEGNQYGLEEAPAPKNGFSIYSAEVEEWDDDAMDIIKKILHWQYRIWQIPLKLAYFIIETLRLKAQFSRLGAGDIDEPVKQVVYLLPGTKIFGHEITDLTEIPAELRPVIVEKL